MSIRRNKRKHQEEVPAPRGGVASVFVALLMLGLVFFIGASGCNGLPVSTMPAANPEAANLYAYATQTAASVNSTATRAQYQRDYAATNSAIVGQETAQAAVATGQAQATATSDHILAQAAADVTREYAAIIQEREKMSSTATAIALQRQMQADGEAAIRQRNRAVFNALFVKVMLIVLGTIGAIALAGVAFVGLRRWDGKPDVITDNQNNPVAISKNFQQLRQAPAPQVQVVRAATPAAAPERTTQLNGQATDLHEAPVVLEYARQRVTFYPRQIAKLRRWVVAGDYGVRRDSSPEGFGLREIGIGSSAYGTTLAVLQGKGYVSIEAPYRWTDRGLAEFLGLELDLE